MQTMTLSRMCRLACLVAAAAVSAVPVWAYTWITWDVTAGGNGHEYAVIEAADVWSTQQLLAQAEGAHLVTITSSAENQFLYSDVYDRFGAWMGLYQDPGTAEPNAGWQWVTGEALSYTHWKAGEPNNGNSQWEEDHGLTNWDFAPPPGGDGGLWNDGQGGSRFAAIMEREREEPNGDDSPELGSWLLLACSGVFGAALTRGCSKRRRSRQ